MNNLRKPLQISLQALLWAAAMLLTQPVLAKLPDGLVLDHGYTYFNIDSTSNSVDGKRIDTGWELIPIVRIFGNAPPRSSIKVVLKKDGDVVAERRTVTQVYGEGNPNLQLVAGNTGAGQQTPHLWVQGGVQGKLPVVTTGTGTYEVEIIYIDGDTNKEYDAHTYTIEVEKADVLDSAAKKLLVRPPNYFVSRHQELLTTVLTPWGDYQSGGRATFYQLLWNVSPLETGMAPSNTTGNSAYLRCTVDGESIRLGNDPERRDMDATVTSLLGNDRYTYQVHSDRNALEFRGGTAYREDIIFNQYQTTLPFQDMTDEYPPEGWRDAEQPQTIVEQHPGRWECQFLDNGTLLRTFAWDVTKDGKLAPHPEQEKGLTLNPGAILVETTIPEGGAAFDGRVVPEAVEAGGFYGWEWRSRDMRKLADKVPEIGNPLPVASAPEFVPEADPGASPQELAKARRAAEAAAAAAERRADQDARDQQRKAEREQYALDEEARLAENERIRSEAMEAEMARSQAELKETLEGVQQNTEEAQKRAEEQTRDAGSSGLHWILRLALSAVLILIGLVLAGGQIPALAGVHKTLLPLAGTIGLAAVGLGLIDFLFDLVNLRPIVGNGLAQIVALIAGGAMAKETVNKLTAGKLASVLDKVEAQGTTVGFAAVAVGVIHLLMGSAIFL